MSKELVRAADSEATPGGTPLDRWSGALVLVGNSLAAQNPLTVVETDSGLTAAIARPFDLSIRMDGIRNTTGDSLIVMSVLRSGAMTFEEHSSQWNHHYTRPSDRIDVCTHPCTRRVITGDRVISFPSDGQHSIDSFQEPCLLEPSQLLREYMRNVRTSDSSQDVFNPDNTRARKAAEKVLEIHALLSPAANEAFGRPGMRALGSGD